jgi:hypothetical protein
MTQAIINPLPLFLDLDGALLDGGFIYIGEAGKDPEAFPLATFWDILLTEATGPLKTRGGYIVRGADPAQVFIAESDYSIRTANMSLQEVLYRSSAISTGTQYQPLNDDLSAISLQDNAIYGMSLLTLPNELALRSATGIPDPLPLAGGTVTGNVSRAGAGPHIYHVNPTFGSGRIFVTANGAADPTSLPGDIWLEKEA